MWLGDSLKSLISGLGTSKDKSAGMVHVLRRLEPEELNAMHRSDWLARKVVDIIPNDMTREWRDWQAKGDQIEAIEAVEKAPLINVAAKVNQALQTARLLGGSLIYMGVDDGDPSQPLDVERVGPGALKYLHVLSCHDVATGEIDQDVASEFYGQPKSYEVNGANGSRVVVHPSRVVRFIGAPILDRRISLVSDAWGDSVLQVVYDAVTNATSAQQHVAALLPEAKLDIITIPGLGEATKTSAGRESLINRFTFASANKSLLNAVLIDGTGLNGSQAGGEKWEQKQISFAQMPELIQQFLKIAAGAADITLVRLLQDAPSGLGANGDTALQSYYDNVAARQRTELSPALHRLDEVIIRSATGARDPDIYYDWSPLWGLSEKERAEVFKMKADAARAIAGTGGASPALMPIEALSDALVNALVEDGSLPGLEAAIEEYGKLSEQEEDEGEEVAALLETGRGMRSIDAEPGGLWVVLEFGRAPTRDFDPSQPREPAGGPDGGQWASAAGHASVRERTESESYRRVNEMADETVETFEKAGVQNITVSRSRTEAGSSTYVEGVLLAESDGETFNVSVGARISDHPPSAGRVLREGSRLQYYEGPTDVGVQERIAADISRRREELNANAPGWARERITTRQAREAESTVRRSSLARVEASAGRRRAAWESYLSSQNTEGWTATRIGKLQKEWRKRNPIENF